MIALKVEVDEGQRYRFGDLNLPGLDGAHRRRLLTRWEREMRGRPVSLDGPELFFRRQFRPVLRPYPAWGYLEYTTMRINDKAGTVDYEIRFVPNELVEMILPRPRVPQK